MSLKSFFKLVEIQTKVASILPFLIGIAFAYYRYAQLHWINVGVMLVSLLGIDMATTAINNYMDFKKAKTTEGYGFQVHNAISAYKLKESHVKIVIGALLSVASISGLILVINTDLLVLLIGMLSFGVGIAYSYGPLPLSRTPLGEAFSGFFMGFVILFLGVYINVLDTGMVVFWTNGWVLTVSAQVFEIIVLFFVSVPLMAGISNIMLANNICDMDEDQKNHRFTLPLAIGKQNALMLFNFLAIIGYVLILFLALVGVLPNLCLLTLVGLIPLKKSLETFNLVQSKKDTFVLAVKSFVLLNGLYLISLSAGILSKWIYYHVI